MLPLTLPQYSLRKIKLTECEHHVAALMMCQTYTHIHEGKLVRQNFSVDALVDNNKKTPVPPSFLIKQGVKKYMLKNISGPTSVKITKN